MIQPFPTSGTLAANLDRSKDELAELVRDASAEVTHSYVLKTVTILASVEFRQHGSSPNFQGEVLSLCIGKEKLRTALAPPEWPGKWLAGFSRRSFDGYHWLIFLAQVDYTCESHSEAWHLLPPDVCLAKCASWSPTGDLYEPRRRRRLSKSDEFDPAQYRVSSCPITSSALQAFQRFLQSRLGPRARTATLFAAACRSGWIDAFRLQFWAL
jgi:hypothetical protein